MNKNLAIIAYFYCMAIIEAQVFNTESTMRTANSIEIQACVNPHIVLSAQLDQVREKVHSDIQSILKSSAVYHVQTYTNTEPGSRGGTCFMYVFQAISPEKAREAISLLTYFPTTIYLNPTTTNDAVPLSFKFSPWRGTEETFMNLGWSVKGTDLVLWGACAGAVLVVCTVGVCFMTYVSIAKDHLIAKKILEEEKRLLNYSSHPPQNKKKKNKALNKDIEEK